MKERINNPYKKIDDQDIAFFREVVGESFVLTHPEALVNYAKDETPDESLHHLPEAVVKPKEVKEIQKIMRYCFEKNIPVTPRGAGSGLSGGAIPAQSGIVLSLERMNRILEIDPENFIVVVEPGVITNEINRKLKGFGLFYAGYPMSLETCQIGGNIAENAGGGKAVKYGVTGHYVRGLEIVTSWGEVLHFGGKTQKDVTGYDILHLLVGSEGTLAIVTKIYLRVLPRPRERAVLLCPFSSIEAALKTPWLIMGELGIVPTALELMSHQSLEFAYRYCESAYPCQEAPCHLLVEIDGQGEEEVFNSYRLVGEKLLAEGAKEVFVADESSSAEEIWKIRRAIPEAIHQTLPLEINEDVSLPLTALHSFINFIEQLGRENDLLFPFYGHLGDGNLHVTLAPRKSEGWETLEPRLRKKFYQEVKRLGGALTGEHGVGLKRKKYLPIFLGPSELHLLQSIKQVFDPKGILNPGKIFPEDLT